MHPYFPFLMHSYFPKIEHICFLVTFCNLTGMNPAIGYYSYTKPLYAIQKIFF